MRSLLPLVLGFLVLAGCRPAAAPASSPQPGWSVVVRDDLPHEVRLTRRPERIVCLAPAHTETLYALGAGDRVVAADTYSDHPAEVKPKAVLQCWPRPPLEQIIALKPDLVVVLTQDQAFVKQMDAANIPVLKLFPSTVERALEEIVILGQVTGQEPRAREIVADIRARFARVAQRIKAQPRPSYMLELDAMDPAKPYVAGGQGFYADLLALAGGRNVFDDVPGPAGPVSAEQVVSRNPEVILLGDTRSPVQPQSPEKVRRRPGWNTVAAVRTGRIHPVNSDFITRTGPRLVEGVETVARLLYPTRFK